MIVGNRFAMLIASLVVVLGACMPAGGGRRGLVAPPALVPEPVYVNYGMVPGLDGFSHAVKVGPNVYISGEVALDSLGRIVGAGDLRQQIDQSFGNLERVLRLARGTTSDLVRLTIFIVHPTTEDYRLVHEVATALFSPAKRPAVTLVGIESLPMAGLRVAIDGQALIRAEFPEKESARR